MNLCSRGDKRFDASTDCWDGKDWLPRCGAVFDPLTCFFSPEGRLALFNVSGRVHIIYPWWNLVAIWLFGEHYYSPVFLNVGLTFLAGYFLHRTLGLVGFEKRYRQAFYV